MGSSSVEYAPPDPSLPTPWKALVDGKTGYIYYWNTQTNVTQYEKPANNNNNNNNPPLPPQDTNGPNPTPQGGGGGAAGYSHPALQGQGQGRSYDHGSSSFRVGGQIQTETLTHTQTLSQNQGDQGQGRDHGPSSFHRGGFGKSNLDNPGQLQNPPNGRVASGGSLHSVIGSIRGTNSSNNPSQPKLAAIPLPRAQQGMGPSTHMHSPHLGVGQANNVTAPLVHSGTEPTPNFKRPASYGQDPYKRSQTQGFFEPTATFTDVQSYMRQHEVTVLGENIPPPFMTFDATGFPPEIMKEFHAAGFVAPTPIQAQSWPVALQSRDVVAIAKTGSGKTLGYLLPAFLQLARSRINSHLGPSVLVLAPTRELATQIQEEAVKFGRPLRISSTCVYGGAPKGPQLRDLERGANIVIATPGRLNDFLEVRKINLRQVTYLVLDEADRMLDMGFEPQIRKIVKEIPARRQTLMYTATWPKEVRKIADDLLVNPVHVNIGNSDELTVNRAITQYVECIPPYEKQRRLEQILRGQDPGSKIIIFCSTKKMCDQLSRSLGRAFRAAAIHGDKSQSERDYVLAQFKQGRSPILVATDVAARGLDIKDIRVVINFDFPTGIEDYVHRIGRTGRAGATGVAHTFFSEQDGKYARELVKVLEGANQRVPLELRDIATRSSHLKGRSGRWGDGGSRGGRSTFGRHDNSSSGSFAPSLIDRRDKPLDRFGDRERERERLTDRGDGFWDRNRGRDMGSNNRRFNGRKDRAHSSSSSGSRSRSRSRSWSRDKYSSDRPPQFRGSARRSASPKGGGGASYNIHQDASYQSARVGGVGAFLKQSFGAASQRLPEIQSETLHPRDTFPQNASQRNEPSPYAVTGDFASRAPPKDVSGLPTNSSLGRAVPYESSPGMVAGTSCIQSEEPVFASKG